MPTRRIFVASAVAAAGAAVAAAQVPSHWRTIARQRLADPHPRPPAARAAFAPAEGWAAKLVAAGLGQIGQTTSYDGSYAAIGYPGGDVPLETGVCTDVIIRAYRGAFGFDLQKAVHEDMRLSFASYPRLWGLKRPDRNIDHRRVPNLKTFMRRKGAEHAVTDVPAHYRPGDLVTMLLPGNLPHIAIVTGHASADGKRPLIVHNIGAGARLDDLLFAFRLDGHYRFNPAQA